MESECSVVNCENTSSETNDKVFFKFPLAFDMCMQWVQNTGNQKLLQDVSLGGTQVIEKSICSDHFSDEDFKVFGQPHSGLRSHAVPLVAKRNPKSKAGPKYKPKINKKVKTSRRSKVDPTLEKICATEITHPLVNPEDTNTESSKDNDVLPFISIKVEPDLPDEIEKTLPMPLVKGENVLRIDQLLKTPKVEEADTEEDLLPDDYTDANGSETAEDQLQDLEGYSDEDIDDPGGDPTKERNFEQKRRDALRQARARQRETPEQRVLRLEKIRVRAQERRTHESEVETTIRRYKSAVRAADKRSSETEEEKRLRQEKNKIRAAERRKNMTQKERAEWREKNRIQTRERRQKESDLKKMIRRYNNAIRASIKRSSETPEQRMERRLKDALRAAERRKMETPEERQERLRKDRERITLRRLQMLMSETPEQREARLKRERERMYRKRHGIKGDISTETSNDGMDSQNGSEDDYQQDLSAILSMYPPAVEIQTPDDVESDKTVTEC